MKMEINDYEIGLEITKYAHGDGLAIQLWTMEEGIPSEPYATLTVNLSGDFMNEALIFNKETDAFVDTNNFPEAQEFIEKYKLGENTGFVGKSSFCTYPVYHFDLEKLNEYSVKI